MNPRPSSVNFLAVGRQVVRDEADALHALAESLGPPFSAACDLILRAPRQLIVTGLGKSGLIAAKIAATLTSTGTVARAIHPVEGLHGDLGIVQPGDPLLALSRSGHTEEIVRFVNHFKRIGGDVIAVCEPGPSPLTELATIVLELPKRPEAGPLQLAPTTSTTLMLALGDALAMALVDARGLRAEQFAQFHPEGSLGKRLLLRAADVMHSGDQLPRVPASADFDRLILEITGKHLGMACIVEPAGALVGVFTDGDFRRLLGRVTDRQRLFALKAREAWRLSRRDPDEPPVPHSSVPPQTPAVECLRLMREAQITALVVAEADNVPLGIVRLQDLVRAGLG